MVPCSKLGVSCRPRREMLPSAYHQSYGRRGHCSSTLSCMLEDRQGRGSWDPARQTREGLRCQQSDLRLHLRLGQVTMRMSCSRRASKSGQNGCTWTMAALVRTSKNLTHLLMCDRRNSKLTVEPRGRVACRCARNRGSHHPFCSSLALPALGLVDPSPGAHPLARLARRFRARAVISVAPRKHLRRKKLGARATPSRTEIRMKLNGGVVREWLRQYWTWRASGGRERRQLGGLVPGIIVCLRVVGTVIASPSQSSKGPH